VCIWRIVVAAILARLWKSWLMNLHMHMLGKLTWCNWISKSSRSFFEKNFAPPLTATHKNLQYLMSSSDAFGTIVVGLKGLTLSLGAEGTFSPSPKRVRQLYLVRVVKCKHKTLFFFWNVHHFLSFFHAFITCFHAFFPSFLLVKDFRLKACREHPSPRTLLWIMSLLSSIYMYIYKYVYV